MRIALFSGCRLSEVGGTQRHVLELARALRSLGAEVSVSDRPDGWEGADLVHVHNPFSLAAVRAIRAAGRARVPTVVTNHTVIPGYSSQAVGAVLSAMGAAVKGLSGDGTYTAVSPAAAKVMARLTGREVEVVPNGVDVERFSPGGEPEPASFLFVGRLVFRKGVHVLLAAAALASKRVPGIRVRVIGDGPLAGPLRSLARSLGLGRRVEFLGRVDDGRLVDLYRRSTALVLPSLYGESFGLVVLEAAACGRPSIGTSHGGLGEVIRNGETGFLVKPGDVRALADMMVALAEDPRLADEMGARARREVEERYDWGVVAREYMRVYSGTVG